MAKLLTLTKKELEDRTLYYIGRLSEHGDCRDGAAQDLEVSRRTVDGWCGPADPRVIPAQKLLELITEVTFHQLYVLNHLKIVDIYDADDEFLGATNRVPEALFLADMHGGYIQRRPIKHARFATDIVISEQQRVRSQLRKIIYSGKLSKKQICSVMGCDGYRLIDMISEVGRHNFGVQPDSFKVSLLETYIRAQVEEYAA